MHEYHALWIGHSVHHSGEDYHMGPGLRQGVGQAFTWPFYLPFALLGFHPHAFAAHEQLNTLYMFWIHTDLVNRLPFGLEYVLNSPMAHRMHHRPPGNCNYTGMFIIWDRLFGTYRAAEVRKDIYGLAQQPNTFDPLVINLAHVRRMHGSGFSVWRMLTGRRVPASWTCSPAALFAPIPPVAADKRAAGPQRAKWDGARGAPPLSSLANAWVVLVLVGCLVCSLRCPPPPPCCEAAQPMRLRRQAAPRRQAHAARTRLWRERRVGRHVCGDRAGVRPPRAVWARAPAVRPGTRRPRRMRVDVSAVRAHARLLALAGASCWAARSEGRGGAARRGACLHAAPRCGGQEGSQRERDFSR
jgi:hypothetical protein